MTDAEIAIERVTNWVAKRQDDVSLSPTIKAFIGDITFLVMMAKSSIRQSMEIARLKAGLLSVIQSELPEGEPCPIDPGGFAGIIVTHMDHEAYREAIRKAQEILKAAE